MRRTSQASPASASPCVTGQPATDAISCSLPHDRIKPGREKEIFDALQATRLSIEQMAPTDIAPAGLAPALSPGP